MRPSNFDARQTGRWRRARLLCLGLLAAAVALAGCRTSSDGTPDSPIEKMVGSAPGADDEARRLDEASAPADDADVRRGVLWYQLHLSEERARIHVRLLDPPDRASFFLPGRWAGREDFDDNISISGARNEEGPTPYSVERDARRIDVASQDARFVELTYSVELDRGEDSMRRFHPKVADGVLFAYGPAFLILPSEQISRQIRDIPVEVRTPADWKVLTTWNDVDDHRSREVDDEHVYGFHAQNPGALRDTFVAAGAELDVHRARPAGDQSALTIGFSPGVDADRARFTDSIARLVAAYRKRFGDLGEVTAFVRGVEDRASRRARGVGRRGGFVVELPSEQTLDEHALLLLAHEAFHLWNGHHLTAAPSDEQETRWFKEGVTHYIALQTLAELGLFSKSDVLRELSRAARYYLGNPAAHSPTASAGERARLPYDRGVLLAVGLDATLLRESGGQIALKDWVSHLIEQTSEADGGYRTADLRRGLIEMAGSSDAEAVRFWDEHVELPGRLDLAKMFELAGLHWLDGDAQRRSRLLPLDRPNSLFSTMFPTQTQ